MIELKGQTESGEWVEFEASSICRADKTYMIVWTGCDPYYELLLIDTIQPADDHSGAACCAQVVRGRGMIIAADLFCGVQ